MAQVSDPKCIFIGGSGRSGTTLLGSALGAAPGAVVTHESHFKRRLLERGRAAQDGLSARSLYDLVLQDDQFTAMWEMKPEVRIEGSAADGFDLARRVIFDIVDQYALRIGRLPWRYWIDHSPLNVALIRDLLQLAPDARFIHLVRDGRAVAASILPLDWGPSDALTAGPWWVCQLAPGLAAELAFPDHVMQVRYEDLVTDPEPVLRRICAFTGLEYTAGMMNADALPKTFYVQGTHRLVGSGISKTQVEAWRTKLSRRQLELFEYGAGELLDILGYGRATRASECRPTDLERAVSQLSGPFRKLGKRWRHRSREIRAVAGMRARKSQPVSQA